jgi:hypothetical protein
MVILLDKFKVTSRLEINDITKFWDIGKVQGEHILNELKNILGHGQMKKKIQAS